METLVAASSRVQRLAPTGREIRSVGYCRLLRVESVALMLRPTEQHLHLSRLTNVRVEFCTVTNGFCCLYAAAALTVVIEHEVLLQQSPLYDLF